MLVSFLGKNGSKLLQKGKKTMAVLKYYGFRPCSVFSTEKPFGVGAATDYLSLRHDFQSVQFPTQRTLPYYTYYGAQIVKLFFSYSPPKLIPTTTDLLPMASILSLFSVDFESFSSRLRVASCSQLDNDSETTRNDRNTTRNRLAPWEGGSVVVGDESGTWGGL